MSRQFEPVSWPELTRNGQPALESVATFRAHMDGAIGGLRFDRLAA